MPSMCLQRTLAVNSVVEYEAQRRIQVGLVGTWTVGRSQRVGRTTGGPLTCLLWSSAHSALASFHDIFGRRNTTTYMPPTVSNGKSLPHATNALETEVLAEYKRIVHNLDEVCSVHRFRSSTF